MLQGPPTLRTATPPAFATIISDLTLHPTTSRSSPLGTATTSAGPSIWPEAFAQETTTPAFNPGHYQGDPTALRERSTALEAHHEQLRLLVKEFADLLPVLPHPPTPSSNPFDTTYGIKAGNRDHHGPIAAVRSAPWATL